MSGRVKAAFSFFGILLIDQLVKYYVELTMLPGESIPVASPFFHITFVLNPGRRLASSAISSGSSS